MKFSFMLETKAEAGDALDDLRDQLEALGHEFCVSRGEFMPPPWFNVFSEGIHEALPDRLAALAHTGHRLVVLVSEQPTLVSREGLVWNYRPDGEWLRRAEDFVKSAPYFTAAWCYAPDSARVIRQFVPRAADVDLGWGRRYEASRRPVVPTHDFCFFGLLTPRRERAINEFGRRGHSVDVIPHSTPLAARDQRIPNSRVVLDLKQHHWWNHLVSSVRYVTAIGCGRPVVAEARAETAKGAWAEIVRFAGDDDFGRVAVAALAEWESLYQHQLAALKAKPSLLAEAVAILETVP